MMGLCVREQAADQPAGGLHQVVIGVPQLGAAAEVFEGKRR